MNRSPNKKSGISSVGDLISDKNNTLAKLVSHASVLVAVETLIISHAEADLSTQFQVAAMRQDRLVLLTPTAAWATRLRMQSAQMLHFLQTSGYPHLRHIDIRVAPLNREQKENPVRRNLSPAAELAFSLMSHMSDGPDDEPDN